MRNQGHILLIDDEPHVLHATTQTLELAGFEVFGFTHTTDALRVIDRDWPGIIISDLRMPRLDGIELMQKTQARDSDIPFILISGHADISDAVKAIQQGAYDFLEKPYHQGRLKDCARRAQKHRNLILENRRLSTALDGQAKNFWIGNSLPTQALREKLSSASQNQEPLTLIGERGSGKRQAAQAIHQLGMKRGTFETIDCRAIKANTLWIEILQTARHGTLVLQHLDRANHEGLQSLDLLLNNESISLPRLISTSRKALELNEQDNQGIPSSLFYRFTRKSIKIPNLQSRAEDIPLLLRHFLDSESRRLGKSAPMFGSAFLAELMTRDWPDNTRELKGISDSWFAQGEAANELNRADSTVNQETALSLPERISQFERQLITREIVAQSGDMKSTYLALGIPRKTLYDKLSKYKISREEVIADAKNSGG